MYNTSSGQNEEVVLATNFHEPWLPGIPQRLVYQDKSLGFISAEFYVTMNYVEVQVSRNSSSSRPWQVTAIRRLRNMIGVDTAWSPLNDEWTY